jgi:hypothetical protein
MSARWPNLFVVGAAKAGTTSVWRYLDQHPEIYMAELKEPHFFSGYHPPGRTTVSDEEAYLGLFAPGAEAKLRGEASPSYLWLASVAAPAIKRESPAARIVILLRDPVDRAYSAYWQAVRGGAESRSFLEAVRTELRDPSPDGTPSRYVGRGVYADAVELYLDTFPRAVHVAFFEELVADVPGELRRLFRFLGVDAGVAARIEPRPHNVFTQPRTRAAGRVFNSPRARAAGRLLVPRPLRPQVDRLLLTRSGRPEMVAESRAILTAHYTGDVERLRRVLGRDMPWDRFRHARAAAAVRA